MSRADHFGQYAGSFLSLTRRVSTDSLIFPDESSLTVSQAARLTLKAIKPHIPRVYQIIFLTSCAFCILTFLLCAFLLGRKRQQGQLWLFAFRPSPNGKILVPNSIFVLILGISLYLLGWVILLPFSVQVDHRNGSLFDWACVIPLPWTPLVLGAFYSVWGFILSCSPRSPLSQEQRQVSTGNGHLPVCCRPWLLNAVAILLPAFYFLASLCLTIIASTKHSQALSLERKLLPRQQLQFLMSDPSSEPMPSELLLSCKLIWAAYAEIWRFCCISLTVSAICAMTLCIPVYVYCVPNVMLLVQSAYATAPGRKPVSTSDDGPWAILQQAWYLLTAGRPRKQQRGISNLEGLPYNVELRMQEDHYYLTTWRLTVLCIEHISILCLCIPLFAVLPVYLVAVSWPAMVVKGDMGPSALVAMLYCAIVTVLACTHVALGCTVITFDPLFRAVVGISNSSAWGSAPNGSRQNSVVKAVNVSLPRPLSVNQSRKDRIAIRAIVSAEANAASKVPIIQVSSIKCEADVGEEEPQLSFESSKNLQRSKESERQVSKHLPQPGQSFLDLSGDDD